MKLAMLAGALLLACAPVHATELPPAFVKVDFQTGNGSAFHIGGGKFVTAAHVIADGKPIVLEAMDGSMRAATVFWQSSSHDVAVLVSDADWLGAVTISCSPSAVGTPVIAHGYPLGIQHMETRGYIAGQPVYRGLLPVDMTLLPGMSGGAVTDPDGDVVGLAVSAATVEVDPEGRSVSGIGLAVPGPVLCELLETHATN